MKDFSNPFFIKKNQSPEETGLILLSRLFCGGVDSHRISFFLAVAIFYTLSSHFSLSSLSSQGSFHFFLVLYERQPAFDYLFTYEPADHGFDDRRRPG